MNQRINDNLRRAWGEFIKSRSEWTHWVTVTFRRPQSDKTARRVLRDWAHAIAGRLQLHFEVAWSVEPHVSSGHHIHALLALPNGHGLSDVTLERLLREQMATVGRIEIAGYDANQGAATYMAKTGEVDLTIACPRLPPCRKHGCTQGRWVIT